MDILHACGQLRTARTAVYLTCPFSLSIENVLTGSRKWISPSRNDSHCHAHAGSKSWTKAREAERARTAGAAAGAAAGNGREPAGQQAAPRGTREDAGGLEG